MEPETASDHNGDGSRHERGSARGKRTNRHKVVMCESVGVEELVADTQQNAAPVPACVRPLC